MSINSLLQDTYYQPATTQQSTVRECEMKCESFLVVTSRSLVTMDISSGRHQSEDESLHRHRHNQPQQQYVFQTYKLDDGQQIIQRVEVYLQLTWSVALVLNKIFLREN